MSQYSIFVYNPSETQFMFENIPWMEIIKILAALLGGGLMGAFVNNYYAEKRNRIQPVGKKLTVNYVDLPKIMTGYEAKITVTSMADGGDYQSQLFEKLAIVRLELSNDGNKDFEKFEIGINLPIGTEAIGLQSDTGDRYHKFTCKQKVSMENTTNELDFEIAPFHRKEKYSVTLITKTDSDKLIEEITLSKSQSIKFVNLVEFDIDQYIKEVENIGSTSVIGSIFMGPLSFVFFIRKLLNLIK